MKKIISFTVTVFTVATLFAAARPSLDGRALVADSGAMPKGLFARTIGYLPGDSVAVTNPATGSTVDVLILGAIDPTEGVAILLSPEAADKLQIKKDSNVQVKITKRAGSLDEAVSGTAMLAEGADLAYADEEPVEEFIGNDIKPITQEYTAPGSIVEETPAGITEEDPYSTLPTFDGGAVAEDPYGIPSYTVDTATTGADPTQPVIIEYTPYPTEDTTATSGIVEEVPADNYGVNTDTLPTYGDDGVDTYLNDLATSLRPDDGSVTEFVPDQPSTDYGVSEYNPSEYVEDTTVPEVTPADTALVPDVAPAFEAAANSENYALEDVPAPNASVAPVVEETPAVVEDTPAVGETPPVAEETPAVTEVPADTANDYQPIVLVPADENPPASDSAVSGTTPVEVTSVPEVPAPSANVVAEPEPSAFDMEKYLVPSLKDLRGGKYYVQIASLGKPENIEAILQKYAEKYPMVLVPSTNGKTYQVMVGPLGVDEYNAILSKFKAFGFKDAFLRKIREGSAYDPK